MSAADQKVELLETKALRMFIHVTREIDFGDRFLLSMLHWCGFGRRSTPLDYWKVFLLRVRARLWECRDFTGNQESPKLFAGSAGLPFAPEFEDRASEGTQCTRSSTLRNVFRLKNFGFIRARRMTSQSTFTRVSAS